MIDYVKDKFTCCVLGLGYIGLPTAALIAKSKNKVIGVDINKKVVDLVNNGKIHIVEDGLENLVCEVVNNGTNTYPSTPSFTFGDGDIIGLALDIPGGTIKWYKNNSLGYTRNLSDITSGGNEDSVYFFTVVDGSYTS